MPCQKDIEKFCKAVEPGSGRKYYCLEKHKAELNPQCHRFLSGLDENYKEMAAERNETVDQLLAHFYAVHEAKTTRHIPIVNAAPKKPAPDSPPPKKPAPASPTGSNESK